MRFYLDEDLSQRIAEITRTLGSDVTSVQELDRRGIEDDAQLLLAAEEHRAIVTRNRNHFTYWTFQFQARGLPHAGVLLDTLVAEQR